MIELKAPLSIKNEYVLELYDKYGALKDTAYAYNLVTNNFWNKLFTKAGTKGGRPFRCMRLGTGTGTPSVSDTALFKSLVEVTCSKISEQYAYPTSTVVYKAEFPASTSATGVITEVGFSDGNYTPYLQTHALLQDSEGNPITINKTDTDTIIVTATVHLTVSPSDKLNMVPANSFIGVRLFSGNFPMNIAPDVADLRASPYSASTVSSNSYTSGTCSASDRCYSTSTLRVAASTGNNTYINAIFVSNVGYVALPDEAVFPQYELQPMLVGTGDGVTAAFICPIPDFVENTEVITVDGAELIRGIDYTVDPVGNSTLNASSINAHSNMAYSVSGTKKIQASGRGIYPFGFKSFASGANSNSYTISTVDNPIIFDLGSEKTCNAIFIDSLTNYSASSSAVSCAIHLEYSDDMQNWLSATSFDERFVGTSSISKLPIEYINKLVKFEPITARYWRVYASGSSSYINHPGLTSGGGNSFFGYVGDGIVFKEPPAEGTEIKIKATVNRPYKTSDYVLDYQVTTYL